MPVEIGEPLQLADKLRVQAYAGVRGRVTPRLDSLGASSCSPTSTVRLRTSLRVRSGLHSAGIARSSNVVEIGGWLEGMAQPLDVAELVEARVAAPVRRIVGGRVHNPVHGGVAWAVRAFVRAQAGEQVTGRRWRP